MTKNKVLIVDDEEDFCHCTKMSLEQTGKFETTICTCGDKASKFAKKYKPDLILLDINMPHKDGFEVLKQIKDDEETRHIPVIILSGMDNERDKQIGARLYDEDYITKPVGTEELTSRIEKVLNKRKGIF